MIPGVRAFAGGLRSGRDLPLAALTVAAALSSIAALLLQAAGLMRMPYGVSFLSLPGLLLLACITVYAGRTDRALLFNRVVEGFWAGAVGLVAYDGIRLLVRAAVPLGFDPFFSIRTFGYLMTGLPLASAGALAAGWAYHVSNGLTFGVIYAVLAGPARWWWGLGWGVVLELGMLAVYPAIYRPAPLKAFLLVSIIGHAAFGAVVGTWCARRTLARPAGRVPA